MFATFSLICDLYSWRTLHKNNCSNSCKKNDRKVNGGTKSEINGGMLKAQGRSRKQKRKEKRKTMKINKGK